jgi:hypothetical protein
MKQKIPKLLRGEASQSEDEEDTEFGKTDSTLEVNDADSEQPEKGAHIDDSYEPNSVMENDEWSQMDNYEPFALLEDEEEEDNDQDDNNEDDQDPEELDDDTDQ